MRKFLSVLALVLLPLGAAAASLQVMVQGTLVVFSDVPDDAWFATYVRAAAEAGIVGGYTDAQGRLTGKYGPGDNVTIVQALKMSVVAAGYDAESFRSHCIKVTWMDACNHWAAAYVGTSKALDFAIPDIGVDINRAATRAEVAAIVADAFRVDQSSPQDHPFADMKINDQHAWAVAALSRDGIVTGDANAQGMPTGFFRPWDSVNRAEAVKIVMAARAEYGTPGEGRVSDNPPTTPFGPRIIDVTVENFKYTPSQIRVTQGEEVVLHLHGFDGKHGFAIPDLGINVAVEAGKTVEVTIPTDAKGTFSFFCSIPCGSGHQTMNGTIVID